MTIELLSIFGNFDWMYGQPSHYVTTSLFTLALTVFVGSMYVIMKIKKRNQEQ